jgi:hypothetical protein
LTPPPGGKGEGTAKPKKGAEVPAWPWCIYSYSDDHYGCEFRYPDTWAVTVRADADGRLVMAGPKEGVPVVYVFWADLSQGQTPAAFLEVKLKALAGLTEDVEDFEVVSREATGLDCPQATCTFRDLKADRVKKKVREVVVPHNSGVLSFRLIAEEERFGAYEPAFDDLLASLKLDVSG